MYSSVKALGLVAVVSLSSPICYANENFNITIDALGQTVSHGFSFAENTFDTFDSDQLEMTFSGFDRNIDTAAASLDFRGLNMQLEYPDLGGARLQLRIPSIGIDEEFIGSTRKESEDMLEDFFKGKSSVVINDILKALAAVSSTDPLAGNPNSLMSEMISSDFDIGMMDNQTTNNIKNSETDAAQDNQIGVGLRIDNMDINGREVKSYHLPLSYTIRMDSNPRHQLRISLPLSYTKTDQAEAYKAGLGIAYSFPVSENWSLTPSLSYGLIGSPDMASAGAVLGMSLTSRYQWDLSEDSSIVLGNAIGKYETSSLEYDDYELNPDIKNTVYTNGLNYSFGMFQFIKTTIFVTDTVFTGDDLYVEHTDELGVVFSPLSSGSALLDSHAKIGFSYLTTDADDLDGFRIRFSSSF